MQAAGIQEGISPAWLCATRDSLRMGLKGASTGLWGNGGLLLTAEAAAGPRTKSMGWLLHQQLSDSDPARSHPQHHRGPSNF